MTMNATTDIEIDVIYNEDCMSGLRNIPDGSVNCCVTSPPYFCARDYGYDGQLGMEETPDEYVAKMVAVFDEVRRAMSDDGTLWLNIGDGYNRDKTGNASVARIWNMDVARNMRKRKWDGAKTGDLLGIPWMLAFALRDAGWYLRQEIIWAKPYPIPESVTNRFTLAHEHIFMLAKSETYYFDYEAVSEPAICAGHTKNGRTQGETRRRRDVWMIPQGGGYSGHIAAFPKEIPSICIRAGCPKGGVVLDPFMGSGTTAVAAVELGRHYIGFEMGEEYCRKARERVRNECGLLVGLL